MCRQSEIAHEVDSNLFFICDIDDVSNEEQKNFYEVHRAYTFVSKKLKLPIECLMWSPKHHKTCLFNSTEDTTAERKRNCEDEFCGKGIKDRRVQIFLKWRDNIESQVRLSSNLSIKNSIGEEKEKVVCLEQSISLPWCDTCVIQGEASTYSHQTWWALCCSFTIRWAVLKGSG